MTSVMFIYESEICLKVDVSDLVIIQEGYEMDDFWNALGGKKKYASAARLKEEDQSFAPRLFQCSNASGTFRVEELQDFDQEDLCEDDVMILDTYDEIFVWIGKGANEVEKTEALFSATEYIKSDPTGRTLENTHILEIKQGFEPINFTGYFLAWDHLIWENAKTYEDIKKEMDDENVKASKAKEDRLKYSKVYSYKELTRRTKNRDIDIANREKYLSDEDFRRVFGMNRVQFYDKPIWKQVSLKKQMGLF